ncbi:CrcB protein [Arcanobacterium pluranimalium]|uniref:fluoride efflux transporter CrcB n=1 Tax=Arcanobacterium pluranimalium TaxID=108028 RepID=UPI00195DE806|nr:CrcB protein [Arcanobacterium pluranimalium]
MVLSIISVFCGGFLGVSARYILASTFPTNASLPLGILTINMLGCFLLGYISQKIAHSSLKNHIKKHIRLLACTGFLGGFTTYSAIVVDSNLLLAKGQTTLALIYPIFSIVLGVASVALGARLVLPRAPQADKEAQA